MKVIATHENTDFDGFSALVAAAKLFPTAIPVAPHNLNRNVRDFYTLYQDQLALSVPEDLPREPIETVILVDTQVTPHWRGIGPDTNHVIIDHHGFDRSLFGAPFQAGATGAVTTMLVERLQEADLSLSPLEATLFLLGIYEDTGRLSYSGTTARDARVAAYLLERGASLQLVNRFLSYPLTDEQRQLYNQLVQNIQMIEVEGASIGIGAVRSEQYVEEVSVLAHRLRDLFEPDALFILVEMTDHVQLVARSGDGAVNVGAVAVHFGGGGHRRAAAALIRGQDLSEVRDRLIAYLPNAVEPPKRVSQIMSYGVHVLAPETKVAEAAALMQRYGHEGFPVVEGGVLSGIITRREIDRAMHHGLQRAPVRVYMRAEGVSVTPDTGVRTVQQLMTENNLGQIPVVEEGRVIGIVTRTDLIKMWSTEADQAQPPRVSERLQEVLPRPLWELIGAASAMSADMGYSLYAVGGFVRDLLLGLPNLDLDLVVEGDAIALAGALSRRYGGMVRSHRRFGTAKWFADGFWAAAAAGDELGLPEHVDFASARTEFYEKPSALPVVERSSIRQDLHRRDFTINTLAVCLNPDRFGEVLDFFGGRRDLDRGLIRVLHSLSFVEDPTRILRAVRLEARLGFRIEPRTLELVADAAELLGRTSGERVGHELLLILEEDAPEAALARLSALAVLPQVSQAFRFGDAVAAAMPLARATASHWGLAKTDLPALYLCLLLWEADAADILATVSRLRPSRDVARCLRQIPALRGAVASLGSGTVSPGAVVRSLDGFGDLLLCAANAMSEDAGVRRVLHRYAQEWRRVRPELGGEYLRQLGLKPGPVYRRILDALRAAKLDGVVSTREEEASLIARWLDEGLFAPQGEGVGG